MALTPRCRCEQWHRRDSDSPLSILTSCYLCHDSVILKHRLLTHILCSTSDDSTYARPDQLSSPKKDCVGMPGFPIQTLSTPAPAPYSPSRYIRFKESVSKAFLPVPPLDLIWEDKKIHQNAISIGNGDFEPMQRLTLVECFLLIFIRTSTRFYKIGQSCHRFKYSEP